MRREPVPEELLVLARHATKMHGVAAVVGATRVERARVHLDVVQQDLDGTTLRRWCLSHVWPTKFVAGEWDNEADENVVESVTLAYDLLELIR
jgi:hypothetical protein